MRIAVISDIHANREAFEACLDHARRSAVDEYVFLGDYVGYGADPGWVVDSVMGFVNRGSWEPRRGGDRKAGRHE
jgi:Icc-related predicted phosphoesterase